MAPDYESYRLGQAADIEQTLERLQCQPILFVGSGLSQRYFDAPSWPELLKHLCDGCPLLEHDFGYYRQAYTSLADIGSVFADAYREWAWGDGVEQYPDELFDPETPKDIYIKHSIARHLKQLTPDNPSQVKEELADEIELLRQVHPHAIITTNYDAFLEALFPDFEPIIGQQILHQDHTSIGELFKIHGCVTRPTSLVLTSEDYADFMAKKKYLSAKLLTYLVEHPVLFVGYSAEDDNVQAILSDVDEILAKKGELIPNLYMVDWTPDIADDIRPAPEKLLSVEKDRSVRLKNLVADDLDWILEAFGRQQPLQDVPISLLRSLIARNYELIRTDLPRGTVEVDYETLTQTLEEDDGLAKLYGIAVLEDASEVNAQYPYSLTEVAEELGYDYWHPAHELIQRIKDETGVNIKASDNRYHVAIRSGRTGQTRRYSPLAVTLLRRVRDGEDYDLSLDEDDAD